MYILWHAIYDIYNSRIIKSLSLKMPTHTYNRSYSNLDNITTFLNFSPFNDYKLRSQHTYTHLPFFSGFSVFKETATQTDMIMLTTAYRNPLHLWDT